MVSRQTVDRVESVLDGHPAAQSLRFRERTSRPDALMSLFLCRPLQVSCDSRLPAVVEVKLLSQRERRRQGLSTPRAMVTA